MIIIYCLSITGKQTDNYEERRDTNTEPEVEFKREEEEGWFRTA
jgi:hypothetical protein